MTDISCIFLLGLAATLAWVVWSVMLAEYRLAKLRSRLFQARGQLFLLAADKKIAFSDPAYYMLRTLLNGTLRYGHRFNLTSLILSATVRMPSSCPNPFKEWVSHLHRLDPEVREELIAIHKSVFNALGTYMFSGSLFLLFAFLLYQAQQLAKGGIHSMLDNFLQFGKAKQRMSSDLRLAKLEGEIYLRQHYDSKFQLGAPAAA